MIDWLHHHGYLQITTSAVSVVEHYEGVVNASISKSSYLSYVLRMCTVDSLKVVRVHSVPLYCPWLPIVLCISVMSL
jgi:hypothetical protein